MRETASLDFELGDTIDMLRASVRTFVAAEIAPRAAAIDRDAHDVAPLQFVEETAPLGHRATLRDRTRCVRWSDGNR